MNEIVSYGLLRLRLLIYKEQHGARDDDEEISEEESLLFALPECMWCVH